MEEEIEKYIDDLRQSVIAAEHNYEIWWVYKEKDSRAKYLETMNKYSLFFQISIHAHFVAMLVALYRIYEKRRDTIHINVLIQKLEKYPRITEDSKNNFKDSLCRAKPLWVKVSTLRNEAFGHRSKKYSVTEVFERANVTPGELRQLVEVTKSLLNQITLAWDGSTHAFNLDSSKSLIKLLEDLK